MSDRAKIVTNEYEGFIRRLYQDRRRDCRIDLTSRFLSFVSASQMKDALIREAISRAVIRDVANYIPPAELKKKLAQEKREEKYKKEKNQERRDKKNASKLRNEIYAKQHGIPMDQVSNHIIKTGMNALQALCDKAEFADNVVDILDKKYVNGRKFGDCEKSHFIVAASQVARIESQAGGERRLYSKMADLLPHGVTARKFNDRRAVLSVCRQYLDAAL